MFNDSQLITKYAVAGKRSRCTEILINAKKSSGQLRDQAFTETSIISEMWNLILFVGSVCRARGGIWGLSWHASILSVLLVCSNLFCKFALREARRFMEKNARVWIGHSLTRRALQPHTLILLHDLLPRVFPTKRCSIFLALITCSNLFCKEWALSSVELTLTESQRLMTTNIRHQIELEGLI
jgi:hypothetical protein